MFRKATLRRVKRTNPIQAQSMEIANKIEALQKDLHRLTKSIELLEEKAKVGSIYIDRADHYSGTQEAESILTSTEQWGRCPTCSALPRPEAIQLWQMTGDKTLPYICDCGLGRRLEDGAVSEEEWARTLESPEWGEEN